VGLWGKYVDLFNVTGQKLENLIFSLFLLHKISFSKVCNICDKKVFKLSVIQHYALKVAQLVCFSKK
jgi:hypothetical protein